MNRWSPWSPSRRMSLVVRDRLPSWTRAAPSGLKRTVGSSNRTVRLTALSPVVNLASPTPMRRAATMASCGSPRMASAAYRRTSSFSSSVNRSKTSWTSTIGPPSAVLIRTPMGRSPSDRTSASRHGSRGESDATTLSGGSPSPSTLMVRRPRYSSATSASFTPRRSSSSSASRSARLARLDASMSRTSVSMGVWMGSADSQSPVSGTRPSGDREDICGRVLSSARFAPDLLNQLLEHVGIGYPAGSRQATFRDLVVREVSALRDQRIGLRSHDEVVAMEPTDLMGPPGHGDPAPLSEEGRMMARVVGDSTDPVGERQCVGKVREGEDPLEPGDAVAFHEAPVRDLVLESGDLGLGHPRRVVAACDAAFARQCLHRVILPGHLPPGPKPPSLARIEH